jgi:hypothetical protein
MAKFKKNFWRDREVTTDEGKVVPIPEPEWYSREKDPIDRLGGFKGGVNPRPDGSRIPFALVGDKTLPIEKAFEIYKTQHTESFRLKFHNFKTALINGSTFRTMQGVISKPKETVQ